MPASMMNLYENLCQRCARTVYQVDRIGPLKDFTFYHTNCFKCAECGSKLTLKTYCNNQNDQVRYLVIHLLLSVPRYELLIRMLYFSCTNSQIKVSDTYSSSFINT